MDKYHGKIKTVSDNVKNSLQISSILLKLKENETRINNLVDNEINKLSTDYNDIKKDILKNLNNTAINRKNIELKENIINSHISQIDEIKSSLLTLRIKDNDIEKILMILKK